MVRVLQASGQFKVRALSPNPGKHRELAEEVGEADLDRPETSRPHFKGHAAFFWMEGTTISLPHAFQPGRAGPRLFNSILGKCGKYASIISRKHSGLAEYAPRGSMINESHWVPGAGHGIFPHVPIRSSSCFSLFQYPGPILSLSQTYWDT